MSAPIPVTVVFRSYNDRSLLPQTVTALKRQRGVTITWIVLESASTDGSLAWLQAQQPDQLIELEPGSYWSGPVLNRGVAAADTEVVVFLNSDAIMTSDDVLVTLARTLLADPRCVGAFARQTVRRTANQLTRLDYQIAFGERDCLGNDATNLSLVCSAIRRSAWCACPFDERLTFAEDAAWSKEQRDRGNTIVYCDTIAAEHSHDYRFGERLKRAYGDAAALALHRPRRTARTIVGGVLKPLLRRCLHDAWRLLRRGRPDVIPWLPWYRLPQLWGAWLGASDGVRCAAVQDCRRQPVWANRTISAEEDMV